MNQDQQQKLKQLLSGPQGRQLMQLLSKNGGNAMRDAGEAVRQGDTQRAQAIMGPLMEDPEVQKLLRSLEQAMNHG